MSNENNAGVDLDKLKTYDPDNVMGGMKPCDEGRYFKVEDVRELIARHASASQISKDDDAPSNSIEFGGIESDAAAKTEQGPTDDMNEIPRYSIGHDGTGYMRQRENGEYVKLRDVEGVLRRQASAAGAGSKQPILPGCLADRLYEAISIARDRAQHAGSTQRMKKWADTAADLRAALTAKVPAQEAEQAAPAAVTVPEGWLLVSREPSQEQLNYAAYNINRKRNGPDVVTPDLLRECWSNLLHARPAAPAVTEAEQASVLAARAVSDELAGWNAAAKALSERAAGHYRNKDFELQDECLQCASMLHDLKPTAPATMKG